MNRSEGLMAHRSPVLSLAVTALAVAVFFSATAPLASAANSPPAYTNHTVGGVAGWLFNSSSNSSATNYSAWAKSQKFFLGDYLIFNTNANARVIQTKNETTYQKCSTDEDNGDDTFVYSPTAGGPGGAAAAALAVPLTEEGLNYFFSDADDGIQCFQGMRFQISVAHGLGLPPALSQPPPPPYKDPSPPPMSSSSTIPGTSDQGERFYNGASPARVIGGGVCGLAFWGFFGVFLV
ncbi:blue copper protein-like [Phoenix dactylifera]|uniref:Blue copper protein-like n=1 Tax=Phoenix dactylifera TaxID=42345 RepID=A0A8B7CLZ0_PHODC|nr:blue copper protein-like [Phoenix dactylifera]